MAKYEVTLFRPREVWMDFVLSCRGITVSYRAEYGMAILAKQLLERFGDGDLQVTEIGVKPQYAKRHYYTTLLDLASSPTREKVVEKVVDESHITSTQQSALDLCPISVDEWDNKVHGRTSRALFDRGWVFAKNDMVYSIDKAIIEQQAAAEAAKKAASLLEWGQANLQLMKETVSSSQFEAMQLCPCDVSHWKDKVHGKCRKSIIGRVWAVIRDDRVALTPEGQRKFAEAESAFAAKKIADAEAKRIADAEAKAKAEAKMIADAAAKAEAKRIADAKALEKAPVVAVSTNQLDAMRLCPCSVAHWQENAHGKSRNTVIERRWAVIENERVTLTPEGQKKRAEAELLVMVQADASSDGASLVVSINQVEAMKLLPCMNYTWQEKVHGRCRRTVLERGWVVIDNDRVSLTPEGQRLMEKQRTVTATP